MYKRQAYNKLAQEAEAEKAAQEAAKEVADKISGIGTVEYTETCKARIDAAKAAYDKLSDTQKALVTNARCV